MVVPLRVTVTSATSSPEFAIATAKSKTSQTGLASTVGQKSQPTYDFCCLASSHVFGSGAGGPPPLPASLEASGMITPPLPPLAPEPPAWPPLPPAWPSPPQL